MKTPQLLPRPASLPVLDALRGLAALYVVLFHACGLWLVGVEGQEKSALEALHAANGVSGLGIAALSLLRYGRQAVLLFFILSGFCVHYRSAAALAAWSGTGRAPQPAWWQFAWKRLWRLYPTLLVGLALTAIADSAGRSINPGMYAFGQGLPPSLASGIVFAPLTFETLLGNLALQADLMVSHFGSNGPLWSLGIEAWCYALYPIYHRLSVKRGAWGAFRISIAVAALGLIGTATGQMPVLRALVFWPVWCAGALIAEAYVGRVRLPHARFLGILGCASLAAAFIYGQTGDRLQDLWAWACPIAATFAGLMLALPGRASDLVERLAPRVRWLATISYSLYATHYPVLMLICAVWLTSHDGLPVTPWLALGAVGASLGVASLNWVLVERWGQRPAPLALWFRGPLQTFANTIVGQRLKAATTA